MYVTEIPNRNSRPATLLRQSYRQDGKVKTRTLANLSHWPKQKIDAFRRLLRGDTLVSPEDVFTVEASLPHGHVELILGTVRKLGLDRVISAKRCRERDLVIAMIVERILNPCSKLATTRLWHNTTLPEELSVQDAELDELYEALDWLLARQKRIEKKLGQRHLSEGTLALYDVSSSSYYGRTCPLAQFGHNRDGRRDLRCIVYGLLTDAEGRPIAVEVYPGATADPTTVPDQVEKLRQRFGLSRVVLVGDRGMLTDVQIDLLREHPGVGWISSLRNDEIKQLVEGGELQLSLFDKKNLAEISSPDYPGERLVVCSNPLLAAERHRKRQELLEATEDRFQRIAREAARRTRKPLSPEQIGAKVGRLLRQYKMGKHFDWEYEDGKLRWSPRQESIDREADLDGIYVIRTSEPAERLCAEDTVRNYKRLAQVEQAFRCLKGDLRIRPIYLRTEAHVRAHILLCTLAYYVEWHLRRAWAPLLFEEENLEQDRQRRDPVAPAEASAAVKRKKARKRTPDEGLEVHSFETLLEALGTRSRATCRARSNDMEGATFQQITPPTPLQAKARQLLGL